jgi:HlyD family secretion protein
MGKKTKLGIAAAALVVLVGTSVIMAATRRGSGPEVRLESTKRRDLEAIVAGNGYIRPHRRVDIQSDIIGRITQLSVAEGQHVDRGQLLLQIDPTQYQAAVEAARARVSQAMSQEAQSEAQLVQAERAFERTRSLASGQESLVSKQALEEAETQVKVQKTLLESARHGVAQARGALDEALDRLAKTTIRSPMSGVVTRLNVDEGETAMIGTMNNAGSLLLTVADMSSMEAVVKVDETDVPELSIGDSASVQIDAFPRRKFVGRVTEIAHSSVRPPGSSQAMGTTAQAVDFEIVIRLDDPPAGLRSDLSATADIVTSVRNDVLSIPIIAVTVRERGSIEALPQEDPAAQAAADSARATGDVEGVFVIRDGKAHFIPVQVGISGREHFEVISGVSDQDSVIAGPYEAIRSLKHGDPVRRAAATPARPGSVTNRSDSAR